VRVNAFIENLNQWGGDFLSFAWPMLWQSSLLIVALLAIDFLIKRQVRASIRYALWLVVLVKLCLPPTLALPTSPAWWLHKTAAPVVSRLNYTATYDAEPLADIPQNPPLVYTPSRPVMTVAAGLLMASGVVSAGFLVCLSVRWRQITRQVRRAKNSERLTSILNRTPRLAGVKSTVPVKVTGNAMSPAVCGLFRPVILVPESLAEAFSDEQLRVVLLHEMIHLKRRDVWLNVLQALVQIVYWWHPLVWLANARIRRLREEAVDDAVMLALRDEAEAYAPTLLEVAKLALNRPLAGLGLVGILESRSALRQRIERLVNFRAPRKAGLTLISLLGIVAFTAVAVPMGGAPAPVPNPALSGPNTNLVPTNSGNSAMAIPGRHSKVSNEKLVTDRLVQDGKVYYELGMLDEAEQSLQAVLAQNSENLEAQYYLNLVQAAKAIPRTGTIQTSAARKNILDKLNRIQFDQFGPNIRWPLSEVVRELDQLTAGLGSDKNGIHFFTADSSNGRHPMIDPNTGLPAKDTGTKGTEINSVIVTINPPLKNATLASVLDAIVWTADKPIQYSVSDEGIVFSAKNNFEAPQLYSRTFRLNTNAFLANLQKKVGSETNIAVALRRLLLIAGVELSPPESLFYSYGKSMLFVRATKPDLDLVEKVVVELNDAPQIHIKAWFLEMPKGTSDGVRVLGISNQPDLVGILTLENAAVTLRALQSRQGVDELAEPEVTTTCGRQTEMRSTQIITVVTNFAYQETTTNRAVFPQTAKMEFGPVIDISPNLLADGYTIDLNTIASVMQFLGYDKTTNSTVVYDSAGQKIQLPTILPTFAVRKASADVKLWDGQTVVLGGMNAHFYDGGKEVAAEPDYFVKTKAVRGQPDEQDKEILVFVTVTLVDPAGNRVHSEEEMPFAKNSIPPQD
jgi:beta-lactamase regulating signal transducer with metallopeptidase domain